MERTDGSDEGQPSPPARVFERLAQLSGYTWDQSFGPFHSVSVERNMHHRRLQSLTQGA